MLLRKLKKGISFIDPSPSAEALEKAQARGQKPEIHIDAEAEIDLDTLPEKVAKVLLEHEEALYPLPETPAEDVAPAAEETPAELNLERVEEAPALDEAHEA